MHRQRFRTLVAAAGYGKTTALHRWYPAARWYRGAVAGLDRLVREAGAGCVVLDDVPPLPAAELAALRDAVAGLAEPVTVVLASRSPLALPGWAELGAADLALSRDQVAGVLAGEYGLAGVADRLYDATGGWPALVHLAAEALRHGGVPAGPLVPALTAPGSRLAGYLTEEVLPALPPAGAELIRLVGELAPVSAGLCAALGVERPGEALAVLRRLGLLTGTGQLVPLVAGVLGRRPAARVAAGWYERNGPPVAAARAYRLAGDLPGCARVLRSGGAGMIAAGHADAVAELVAALPEAALDRSLRLLRGDALLTRSDLDGAARAYDQVAGAGVPDTALAWRLGRIHYQRGNALAALAVFGRGRQQGASASDLALLLAWTARAQLLAGDAGAALGYAREAVTVAAGLDRELATAYLSVALCLSVAGDPAGSEEYYALALPIAERTDDVILLACIHINRTYQLLRWARFGEALRTAELSARYAAVGGSPSLRAIATCNQADTLAMLGRYDEAVSRYEAALADYQRGGSRRFAGALLGLGTLYRRRGWDEQARAAYEEAVRVATAVGNAHVLVPALAGLALVLLDADPAAATAAAEQAAAGASPEIAGPALLAQGWVALRAGDLAQAAARAAEAARVARSQRDRIGLAEALELRAATEADPARALREAHGIWSEAGAAVEAARIQVLLSRLGGSADRLAGLLAEQTLAAAGVRTDAPPGDVAIQALGRFEVRLAGQPVPPSVWKSRKARDLLRILVARHGRPVPRSELCELLWPDDDQGRTGHRLSVLLNIVRGALDPAKASGVDRFVAADQTSIALDTCQVRVDVEDFLSQVAHGRRLVERGEPAEGRAVLLAADRAHRADAFEDEPYAEWAGPLREEVRAAYLDLLRLLARVTGAADYLLRLLERDPYDEPAHRALVRGLVAGGHHGEARRALARYQGAMRDIGVRPPGEDLLRPAPESVERARGVGVAHQDAGRIGAGSAR